MVIKLCSSAKKLKQRKVSSCYISRQTFNKLRGKLQNFNQSPIFELTGSMMWSSDEPAAIGSFHFAAPESCRHSKSNVDATLRKKSEQIQKEDELEGCVPKFQNC